MVDMGIKITHDLKDKLFYVEIEGKLCKLQYSKVDDKTLDYYSTFVPESLSGRGIAGEITKFALDYAKNNNLKVIPSCSYVKSYIVRHNEYSDLIKI